MSSSRVPDLLPIDVSLGPLPTQTDVVVVGGGIVGAALAYYLAGAGVEVLLLEGGELNREASGTNAGSFHFQIALHQLTSDDAGEDRGRLLDEVRLHLEAADLWSHLEKELDADLGVHETGGLMVAQTPVELQMLHDKQVIEAEAGLETYVLEGEELRSFAPYLADDVLGATYCPREGHANPLTAVPSLALRAHQRGAAIRTHARVTAIDVHDDSAARFTVRTTRGDVRAARVVDACGAWADDIAAMVGLHLPVYASGLHVNVTEQRAHVLTPMVQHIGRRLTLKQTAQGTFIIGGGWPARKVSADARYANYWASAAGNAAVAVSVVPMLADVRLVRTWAGVMAFTDDLSPIVGESSIVPGFHVCVAATGFTLGPMMAGLLADAMIRRDFSGIHPSYAPDRSSERPSHGPQ